MFLLFIHLKNYLLNLIVLQEHLHENIVLHLYFQAGWDSFKKLVEIGLVLFCRPCDKEEFPYKILIMFHHANFIHDEICTV